LELWNGAGGTREAAVLKDLEQAVPELAIDDDVWSLSYALARKARSAGITVPATDLVIAACAKHHGAEIETADADFAAIVRLKI
jgi:hypothetical protein